MKHKIRIYKSPLLRLWYVECAGCPEAHLMSVNVVTLMRGVSTWRDAFRIGYNHQVKHIEGDPYECPGCDTLRDRVGMENPNPKPTAAS